MRRDKGHKGPKGQWTCPFRRWSLGSFMSLMSLVPYFILGETNQENLSEYDQKKIMIRGYPHHSSADEWYLTPHPDTPSCCIASPNKSKEQILLSKFIVEEATKQPITLEGILNISADHPQFTLLEASKIESHEKQFPWITLSIVILIMSLVFLNPVPWILYVLWVPYGILLQLRNKKEVDR